MTRVIAHFRVSTRRQGESGLGLDAQRAAVQAYATAQGNGGRVIAEYVEVESGKRADRPELAKALVHAKRMKATLVVAKLDRLARNVAFTAALLDSGVEFVCCDNPTANRLTIHILAAVAEDKARRISERTKSALAAAKRRGQKLGGARPECRNLTDESRQRGSANGAAAVKQAAESAYREIEPLLSQMRESGLSYRYMAKMLVECLRAHVPQVVERREVTSNDAVTAILLGHKHRVPPEFGERPDTAENTRHLTIRHVDPRDRFAVLIHVPSKIPDPFRSFPRRQAATFFVDACLAADVSQPRHLAAPPEAVVREPLQATRADPPIIVRARRLIFRCDRHLVQIHRAVTHGFHSLRKRAVSVIGPLIVAGELYARCASGRAPKRAKMPGAKLRGE